ncbi:DNA polymerase I [Cupriavidus sp. CuC1]|uniref:DNA polymerase I n=1 Tax=Cupriavidus sp. CuC1 TaxID=3373131 RepID=UPI0037CD0603
MSHRRFWFDLETFSPVPIKHGSHAYAEKAEILLFAYAMDDAVPKVWDVTVNPKPPAELVAAAEDPSVEWWGHNSGMFDWVVIGHAMPWLAEAVPQSRRRDTMVQAYAHSLPGALGTLCEVMSVPLEESKLKTGRELVRLFCIPPAKNLKRGRATRHTHPAEWAEFIEYAGRDITSMRAASKKAPMWNYQGAELDLWCLDQRINYRGMTMDVELAHAAIATVEREQKALAGRTQEMTAGAVESARKRDKLLAYLLAEYGIDLPDLQKSTLERRIDDQSLPWALRELLAIRLQASTSSTSKYTSLIRAVSSDGKLRGTKQFCGAGRTGRWAGRLFQPDNMPRPAVGDLRDDALQRAIDDGIQAMKTGCADLISDNVMELASAAIRGCIVVPRGKKLVVADLSNIEGRKLAWLAGEKWKLQAFRDYDAGTGHDLYKLAYAKSFGIKPEAVDKNQRQVGKVQELALGYEGGVGAFLTFAAAYNLDLEEMAEQAIAAIPAEILDEARGMYQWTLKKRRSTFGLSERAWLVCESFKRSWRYAHPEVTSLWKELGAAAVRATQAPGTTITCRRLKVRRDGAWLRIRLPSGRFLCYPSPQVSEKGEFSYMGVNQYSRKWSRIKSYGGKLVENVTQAAARDVLASSMPHVEAAGYEIVLTVHDEIITEAPDSPDFNADHLAALMSANPPWAEGLPLAAAGFEAYRYRKD